MRVPITHLFILNIIGGFDIFHFNILDRDQSPISLASSGSLAAYIINLLICLIYIFVLISFIHDYIH